MANNRRPNGLTTALLYTRVSTDEQAREGLSLPAQLADARKYAAQYGWIIGGEYQDVLSGKRDDRPNYRALLAEIRRLRAEGRSVAVVCKWLDRFGRSVLERAKSADELRALGVPIHSVMEGGQVSDFVYNILAAVAQEESRRLGERVSEITKHTIANGWHPVGVVKWGYRWREATESERAQGAPRKVMEEDPATAPYVLDAFKRAVSGATIHAVARWVRGLPAEARGGKRMSYQAVRFTLRSPTYIARAWPEGGYSETLDYRERMQGQPSSSSPSIFQMSPRPLLRWNASLRIKCPGRCWRHSARSAGSGPDESQHGATASVRRTWDRDVVSADVLLVKKRVRGCQRLVGTDAHHASCRPRGPVTPFCNRCDWVVGI